MAAGGRQLAIDKALFLMAFGRDADYEAMGSDLSYLDRQTGVVVWIFEIDEDAEMLAGIPADGNRGVREQVEADPDRFLEIPGLDHGDHHDILKAFLRSDWNGDEKRRLNAETAYRGSIGRWKKQVKDRDAINAFHDFRDMLVAKLAEEWLQDNGITPIWR
jgi:hypothetical protein